MNKIIHTTDLFRPHNDIDDHYDLLLEYSLAKKGYSNLEGILVDFPPKHFGAPDIEAISSLSYLFNYPVLFGVGSKDEMASSGEEMLKKILNESKEKIIINIVGSCKDISNFGNKYPNLIKEKVEAIYINAGNAICDNTIEYNVALDPICYMNLFKLETKIYWAPCFDSLDNKSIIQNGSVYEFKNKKILSNLSDELKNYIIFAMKDSNSINYIKRLREEVNPVDFYRIGELNQCGYSTASIIDSANLGVSKDGSINNKKDDPDNLYSFVPIKISKMDSGKINWSYTNNSNIYILRINDTLKYKESILKAYINLVK